jgi:signal transduction histidine kinase
VTLPFSRLAPALCLGLLLAAVAPAQDRVLTKAIEVRSLTPAEAQTGIPVRLRGVVVFVDSPSAIFLQDETSTTFFLLEENAPDRTRAPVPAMGDEIEVTGRTRMGLYMPGLAVSSYRRIGQRELPPGIPVTYDDLHFGRYHYQRVTIEGVVRSVRMRDKTAWRVGIALGSRVTDVWIEEPPPANLTLIGDRVRVTGLAAGLINTPRRQMVQPYVRIFQWSDIEVLTPAPPANQLPEVSADQLLTYQLTGLRDQRVRINGVATAAISNDQVFLRQNDRNFAVRFGTQEYVAPGDHVTVAGFPAMDRFSAVVDDAILLDRKPGVAPTPIVVGSIEKLYGTTGGQDRGEYDGELVQVTATVRDSFRSGEGAIILTRGEGRPVNVWVSNNVPLPPAGAEVRFTGICQVEAPAIGPGFASIAGSVTLRITSPSGLEILRRPPWWTPRRLSLALAAFAGVLLLAGLWIAILRRQVWRQTHALRHRIEAEAALEERQRIAREFHDTLEQELAGVTLRLDALATRIHDEKGQGLVAASRNLVSRIQVETRDLISDLRDSAETAGDLLAALAAVAARYTSDGDVEVRIDARTVLPSLPATTVHDLRMIARESINNARKHGRATHVAVEVEADAERLLLRIVDNGCGFDATTALVGKRGHFGCAGMRERGRKIGAEVTWRSQLQKGTTVEVTLPLAPAKPRGDATAEPIGAAPTARLPASSPAESAS